MKKDKKKVNRWFTAILYEEDPNFEKYFNNILTKFKEVTWITHDRDLDENGENKKKHIHILWNVGQNARTSRSVARDVEIAENYIQGCNKEAVLRYLIHLDNIEKTQYNVNEVRRGAKRKNKRHCS